jgi:glutathione S-transferase
MTSKENGAGAAPILVSHDLCPYVQRAAIALAEKGVAFERVYVDLSDKPDWFISLSPLGKVPLLRVGLPGGDEAVLFESAAILEFLEDTQVPALHPAEPLARARHRAWIEFGSSVLNDIGGFYSAPDEAALTSKAHRLSEKFARVEAELGAGPWFAGERFSLVDAAFGPIFRYFDVFDGIADFGVFTGKPKTLAWRKALSQRPSIRLAVADNYPERLKTFIAARKSHLSSLLALAPRALV